MLPFKPRFGQTFSLRIDPLSLVGAAPACLQAIAKGEGNTFPPAFEAGVLIPPSKERNSKAEVCHSVLPFVPLRL